jgi:uncharacterized membrane protein
MDKPASRRKASDPKVLVGLAIFLVLIGGMVIDPLVGFICFMLAGILTLIAALRGTRRTRYLAFVLLIIIAAVTIVKFPETSHHLGVYKSKTVTEGK